MSAPRPVIAPSTPDKAILSLASYHVKMSPFPIIGILLRLLISPIKFQFALFVYRCSFVRPWTINTLAPAFSISSANFKAGLSSSTPSLIFTDNGKGDPFAKPSTNFASFAGFLNNRAPKPLFVTSWVGHPQFKSTKSALNSYAILADRTPSSMIFVAIWAPKISSESCRRKCVFSTGFPRFKNLA